MDLKKAEQLVEKYYQGRTSPDEELQLREFFRISENIPEHLMPEKEFFSAYSAAAIEDVPIIGFMDNLEKVIDAQVVKNIHTRKSVLYWMSGIAAGLALLLGSYFLIINKPGNINTGLAQHDTYKNPQLAYEETQKVLLYISQKMNKGTVQLSNFSKLNRSVNSLQNLKKLDTGMNKLHMLQFLNNNEKRN